jgi:hypothetical protein
MKDHMVLAVEEKNLALGTADLAAKSLCELYGGKASTDNDYSDWLHFLAPIACLVRLNIAEYPGAFTIAMLNNDIWAL